MECRLCNGWISVEMFCKLYAVCYFLRSGVVLWKERGKTLKNIGLFQKTFLQKEKLKD